MRTAILLSLLLANPAQACNIWLDNDCNDHTMSHPDTALPAPHNGGEVAATIGMLILGGLAIAALAALGGDSGPDATSITTFSDGSRVRTDYYSRY